MGGGEPNPTGDALLSKIVGDGRAGSGVNVGADNPRYAPGKTGQCASNNVEDPAGF